MIKVIGDQKNWRKKSQVE